MCQRWRPTVAHAKNNASLLDSILYLEAVTQTGRHRLLAKYVITLCCKRQHDVSMHMILYSDDDTISQSPSQSLDGLSRCLQEVLPITENERIVDVMGPGE